MGYGSQETIVLENDLTSEVLNLLPVDAISDGFGRSLATSRPVLDRAPHRQARCEPYCRISIAPTVDRRVRRSEGVPACESDSSKSSARGVDVEDLAGRSYARVYRVIKRQDIHDYLVEAVKRSGGEVLYASAADRAPLYLGVQTPAGDRLGLLIYHFRMTDRDTLNRPAEEVRGQIRYGGQESWTGEHRIGQDVAGVDITLMLGVHLDGDVLVGLQPALYDPLPLGISFYAPRQELVTAREAGWTVWERDTAAGKRREQARGEGLETMIAFSPDRLLDYALFERRATDLGLDQPLRFNIAISAAAQRPAEQGATSNLHKLEEEFSLSSREIIEIIAERRRLQVAVLGGVAEHHLEQRLRADPDIANVTRLDLDAQHDFDVTMQDGRLVRVECKNASPHAYANGDFKVEVQKTRASKNDPASRFYGVDQFDVVAACLYSPTRQWDFRYRRTSELEAHKTHAGRLAAMQPVTGAWSATLAAAVA